MELVPRSVSAWCYAVLLAVLALAPFLFEWMEQPFYLDLLSRGLILAIAVISLNLILGYGGMVSLGHAAYLGIGAYCVGIPAYYDLYNGWLHLALALGVSGLFALITGAVSLRTRGVYFIMITMAFSQMVYFIFLSLEEYGADDGLVIYARSEFPAWMSMDGATSLYYWIFILMLLSLFLINRLVHARFGRVIVGSKFNEQRMQALGFDTYRYRLACYVISAMLCSLAGMLLGNFAGFISPDIISWARSGELIFMVIIGGVATIFGPLIGTLAFVVLEEGLSAITVYWHLIFGVMLVALVLFGKGGIHGWLSLLDRKRAEHD
ncbi:MAG: branched-chain amino acid ABC transporter permease [Gammaproteobacteria bacterium]|nr:branched-chain amino acid ABC transporter permease [Gammaproteobacteria bacterium]MDH3448831.1 branched-chain amino acid ABC transporter permease [Gammaproteobacteria bacterium]